jgi:hypothetical protein
MSNRFFRNASTVSGVYDLNDIMSQEERGVLAEAAEAYRAEFEGVDDVAKAVKSKQ